MKLYFMIGLPTEEDEDVARHRRDRRRACSRSAAATSKGAAEVTVSVSTHVPKPHTPFQWCAMDGEGEIARKQALLRRAAPARCA